MSKKKVTKKSVGVVKRGRGRPPGSKNKAKKSKVISRSSAFKTSDDFIKPQVETDSDIGLLDIDLLHGIIKVCTQYKLKSFQYGKLSLVFKNDSALPIVKENAPKHVKGIETVGDLQEHSESVEDRLEYLKITDPVAYEEFAQSEDATDGET